jgi:hypothetical protein
MIKLSYEDPESLFAPRPTHIERTEDTVTLSFESRSQLSFPIPVYVLFVVAGQQAVASEGMPEGWEITSDGGAVSDTAMVRMTKNGVSVELLEDGDSEERMSITVIPLDTVMKILEIPDASPQPDV